MSHPIFDIAGRVVLITGAGQGLGAALAAGFAAAGARLALADRNAETVRATADRIVAEGGTATAHQCDIGDPTAVARWVEATQTTYGTLDVLVNNAGINIPKPAEDITLDDWQQIVGVNLTGTFICAQTVGKVMLAQGSGAIINICSVHGHVGSYVHKALAYNTTKAGLTNLTRSLALEWGDRGVRVNGISPGPLRTELMKARLSNPEYVGKFMDRLALKRIGEPEDIVGTAVFLASPASAWLTGQVIAVDGGWLAA